MQAIEVRKHGGPEVLSYQSVDRPTPDNGQVLIKIAAAGVNFVDTYHRTGQYKIDLPFIPGVEAAGTAVEVGPGVSEVQPGDRVAYVMTRGSYAEYAAVPVDNVVPVPDGVTPHQAAAVMLQGLTAHYLSHTTYPLQEGDVALIHAAAGGVGGLLVQMAKLRGAHVIGTTSTEEKAERARGAGADNVILYTQEDFEEATLRLTEGMGVNVVYDGVGKATFRKGLNVLRPRGYMVLYGQASGAVAPIDPQVLNQKGSLFLTRPTLGDYAATRDELVERASDLFAWMAAGSLDVPVDKAFPLPDAAEAHRYIENRKTKGKLLLLP
ncbi:MAG: quinone oxidoreductase family protein [Anaerolineae bacterium]